MASRLRESDDYPDAHVAGWESRDGSYHTVYNTDGDKVGREPSDQSLESAERVVVELNGEFYTVDAFTDEYDLGEAIAELEDMYGEA
jgi:hypothetical protein